MDFFGSNKEKQPVSASPERMAASNREAVVDQAVNLAIRATLPFADYVPAAPTPTTTEAYALVPDLANRFVQVNIAPMVSQTGQQEQMAA